MIFKPVADFFFVAVVDLLYKHYNNNKRRISTCCFLAIIICKSQFSGLKRLRRRKGGRFSTAHPQLPSTPFINPLLGSIAASAITDNSVIALTFVFIFSPSHLSLLPLHALPTSRVPPPPSI